MTGLEFGYQGSGRQPEGMPSPEYFLDVARHAEHLGFDSLWAGDHLSPRGALLDSTVVLSHFAACTSRIRLGYGVMLVALRHPAVIAKQVATLDWMSKGRVIFGAGVGGEDPKDFEAVGVRLEERGARTDETLDALRELWRAGPRSFSGRFFDFRDVVIDPPPAQPGGPPIWIGGRAQAALRRVARVGTCWFAYLASPRRVAAGLAEIREHAEAAGRDPEAISAGLLAPTFLDEDGPRARSQAQAHLSRRYGQQFEAHVIDRSCLAGTPDEIRTRIGDFVEAGIGHVVFLPAWPADGQAMDRLSLVHEELVAPLRPPPRGR